jgi:hypothetical protein
MLNTEQSYRTEIGSYLPKLNNSDEVSAGRPSKSLEESLELVRALYRGILRREPDEVGLEEWTAGLMNGRSLAEVAQFLVETEEFRRKDARRRFEPPMDAANFLFPRDLEITPTKISKVLVIGSCAAADLLDSFRSIAPDVTFDFVLFNNVSDIGHLSDETVASYDFQFIHLPLRHVVSDDVIDFRSFISGDAADAILERGRNLLAAMLDAALKFNKNHQLLTFVSSFLVPQMPVVASLDEIGSVRDFGEIVRALNKELVALISNYKNVYLEQIPMDFTHSPRA